MRVQVRRPGKAAIRAGSDLRIAVTFYDDTLALPLRIYFVDIEDDETGERELRNVGCELGEQPTDEAAALKMPELTALTFRRVVERYPHWVDLARAHAAMDKERAGELAAGVKRAHPTRLDNDFFGIIAAEYRRHVQEGDPAPVSAIARSHQVTVSGASRWVKTARERGMIDDA